MFDTNVDPVIIVADQQEREDLGEWHNDHAMADEHKMICFSNPAMNDKQRQVLMDNF